MFEKEIMIAGLRKQRDMLRDLVEDLERKSGFENDDFEYCGQVMKKVEEMLKKLRRPFGSCR